MGSCASKQDRDTAMQLCKGRLKHIQQAIDARYALSAAQLSYEQSLRNVGAALKEFVESHHEGAPEKSPRSSCALPSPLRPADSAITPPPPVPRRSDVSRLRSAASASLTVTFSPSDASFVKEGQPVSTSFSPPLPSEVCSSWDFFDPNVVDQHAASHVSDDSQSGCMRNLEDCVQGDEKDLASSISNTSPAAEVQEQLGAYGCKEADDDSNHHRLNHSDCNEIEIVDVHLPNDSNLEKGPDQVQKQSVEGQNPTSISNDIENEAHHVDKVNAPERSCSEEEKGSSITSSSKDFLSDVKKLDRQFARAAESCHEVSRMLETRKIRLSVSTKITGKPSGALSMSVSLICCSAGNVASHESEQHVTKVITWNRSLSSRSSSSKNPFISAQKEADDPADSCSDFVEEFCMISGSHASSLDRLYAWERKIYDGLKNSESIKKIYDKKCAQLTHQSAKDGNARQVDRTRATIKELYSRLMVGIEVLYSNSKIIEKLRDEELQPQLLELLQGQTRMWRMMQEVHQMQHTIISQADAKISAVSPSSESQKHTMMNLITELGFLHSSLASWADAYKNYVGGLHSWLQKCVVQPRDRARGRRLTLSPRQHLAPPLFVLLEDWSSGMTSLPSEESCGSIKNLAADLKKMYKQQTAKKRSSDTGAEDKNAEHGKSDTEAKLATLQGGLTTMFDRLSKLSDAMASLSENVEREAEIAREAYMTGPRSG
ncbi:protein ROLLING AND ERECT LEAF 2-like [Lolium rigidum]|uniref:protein ROLLING AND ERECT LEAF 2-like n=1 Tax=Lolium rigidum TaxID=89674 RepID=UPI001F5E31E4|nr:protein ROLLING AND ERECT LEAF 2-like [Lolium rigidum]